MTADEVDTLRVDPVEMEDHVDVTELIETYCGVVRKPLIEDEVCFDTGPVFVDRLASPSDHVTHGDELDLCQGHWEIIADDSDRNDGSGQESVGPTTTTP